MVAVRDYRMRSVSPLSGQTFILGMATLPPEVTSIILEVLTSGDAGITQSTKTELNLCSLTCRHWASKCRPLLFRKLTLASHGDALTLLELIRRPKSKIGDWISFLVLIQSEPSYPWTQLIYLRLSTRIPKTLEITHVLKWNSTPPSKVPQNLSLHPSVPKSLPSLYYRCIRAHLINLRLRSFSNLIPLVGRLNMCNYLRCTDVSWVERADPATILSLRAGKRRLMHDVLLENCSDVWAYTWLCVTTDLRKAQAASENGLSLPFIRQNELRCLAALICAVHCSHRCKQMRLLSEFYTSPNIRQIIDCNCCCARLGEDFVEGGFSVSLACEEADKCVPDLLVRVDTIGTISTIELVYGIDRGRKTLHLPETSTVSPRSRWEKVIRALATCAGLRKVRVDIDTQLSNVEDASRSLVYGLANLRDVLEIRHRDISSGLPGWKLYTMNHWTGARYILNLGCRELSCLL